MDDFGWRISIADVDVDGPFSVFPMVQRHIVILAGTLRLCFDDGERVICAREAPFSFSGSLPVVGFPVGGPVRDLNLMLRTDRYDGRLRIVDPGHTQTMWLVTVVVSLQAATVMIDTVTFELEAEDALLLSGPAHLKSLSPLILAEMRSLF